MNLWKQLHFFDKNGQYYNFDYDESRDIWTGDIYLPKVSTGLYEVAQIFILEEFIDTNTGIKKFGFPHDMEPSGGGPGSTGGTGQPGAGGWLLEWKDIDPTELFLFQYEADYGEPCKETPKPLIEIYDEIKVHLDYDPNQFYNTQGFLETSIITSEVLAVNIACSSILGDHPAEGNTYKRMLYIRDESTGKLVAEFMIYGETVEEDERLKVMCQNFGYQVLANDSSIFKDTDINEILPDWQELNLKRKEMMMEAQNIYTFLGSYKGLVNVIKYFGYGNLSIKEYWKNVDKTSPMYGMYIQSNPIHAFDPNVNYNDKSITLPNKRFRKTSLFSLIYRINKIIPDTFDDEDLPETEEVFEFSIEEILIKLYGLKQKLEKDFLPLNAHIKDIIGEADFFGLQEVTNTISRNDANSIIAGIDADFKYTPEGCNLIQDLRDIGCLLYPDTTGFCPYPQNLVLGPYKDCCVVGSGIVGSCIIGCDTSEGIPLPPIGPDPHGVLGPPVDGNDFTIKELSDVYLAYFSRYAPNINTLDWVDGESSHRLPDKPGIPVGAPIVLENTSFGKLTWDDVNSTWFQLDNGVYHNFDFEPVSPSMGDTFTITDPATGTGASYTAAPGDTATIVRDALFTQLMTLRTTYVLPWIFYDISDPNTTSGPVVRVWGTTSNLLEITLTKASPLSSAQFLREQVPGTLLFTWDSILRGNFQEIEWTIYKDKDETPAYYYNIRGPLPDYDKLPLILPWIGNYSVEMRLFDLYNNISTQVKLDEICIEGREVDFLGWYQSRKCEYTWHDEGEYIWKDYGSYWDLPIPPVTTWEEEQASLYESLDRVNAILNNFGLGVNPNFTILNWQDNGNVSWRGPYFWDNLDTGDWNDTCHLWWDMTSTTGDTPAFFQFAEVIPNSYLDITDLEGNVGEHYFDASTNTLREAVNQLNLSTDPIIHKYIYNLVLDASNQQIFVQGVARYFGKYGDFKDVDIVDNVGDRICASTVTGFPVSATGCESIIYRSGQSTASNPTWNTAKFIIDGKTLQRMTWIMFVYDNCKISGKTDPKWTITNTTDPNDSNIYFESKYLTYLFKDTGKYKIGLELEDTNGNKYTKEKNILIIK